MNYFRQRLLERLFNFYPPLLGAGIHSRTITENRYPEEKVHVNS